jgi:predicted nucleic acid-binding protein
LKTLLDSGVLMLAWRGNSPAAAAARQILTEASSEFVTCENVQLELLPKATFEKRRSEVEFYNEHFSKAAACEPFSAELGKSALSLAKKYGLAAGDALNLASAIRLGADEFITSELPGKPMFRVAGIKVVSLHKL